MRKTLVYSSSYNILLTSFNVMPSWWFHMIYIFLYIYFGFHRPMLGKFTKALLAEMMAGRSSGTFQKRYVYTVCVYFTNCKYVRLGADHYIFRGRGVAQFFWIVVSTSGCVGKEMAVTRYYIIIMRKWFGIYTSLWCKILQRKFFRELFGIMKNKQKS